MSDGRVVFSGVSSKPSKESLLVVKDGEKGWSSCFFCEASFLGEDLVVLERVPAALGGEFVDDNFFLCCKPCSVRKVVADKLIVKAFRDVGFVGGKKFLCFSTVDLGDLWDLYFGTLSLWGLIREVDLAELLEDYRED